MKKAVISYSGGMDSTCLMMYLLKAGYEIRAYSFDYGQNHSVELKLAKKNIKYLQKLGFPVQHQVINLKDVFSGDPSTLVQHTQAPYGDYREESMKSTVVNNRNVIFSSIIFAKALSWAKSENDNVVISMGVHKGDHCFTEDTEILTTKGLKTVNELKIGDEVYSFDPEIQKICIDKCIDIIEKGTNNEIYNITTSTGTIRLTGEHQVYVCGFDDFNKSKGYIKNILKKSVKDIKIDDYLFTSYKTPDIRDQNIPMINIKDIYSKLYPNSKIYIDSEKFGFICGNGRKSNPINITMNTEHFFNLMAWYISEGYTYLSKNSHSSKYISAFSQSMYKNLENCEDILNTLKILDLTPSFTDSKQIECGRPKETEYRFYSVISAIMQTCGCKSKDKHIPEWMKEILFKSKTLRRSFIHTLCLGDGHFDEFSCKWSYQSNSFELIKDIAELIKIDGLYVKLGRKNKRTNTYTIYFSSKESKQGLVRLGDAAITRVTDIQIDHSKTEKVYDISVEKNHNFFAGNLGNILISNSIYLDCKEESVNMARELYKISNWDSELVDYDAPFVNISKSEVLGEGLKAMRELHLTKPQIKQILKNTMSCYNAADGKACGKCGTCRERLEAFYMNKMKDPIPYNGDYQELLDDIVNLKLGL